MDFFHRTCKSHHLKITPQRIAVYDALKKNQGHPSADEIHRTVKKVFPHISLDTVNRTLMTFADIHLIDIVEGQGAPRRFEANPAPHHHFYCLGCSAIIDVFDDALDRISIPREIEEKYTITGKRVCIKGFCDKCSP